MPTTKPRLNVTLSPESRVALERFSQVTGMASSSFIAKLVHDAIPVINATADAIEIAKRSPAKAAALMNQAVVGGITEVVQAQLELDQRTRIGKKLRKRPAR